MKAAPEGAALHADGDGLFQRLVAEGVELIAQYQAARLDVGLVCNLESAGAAVRAYAVRKDRLVIEACVAVFALQEPVPGDVGFKTCANRIAGERAVMRAGWQIEGRLTVAAQCVDHGIGIDQVAKPAARSPHIVQVEVKVGCSVKEADIAVDAVEIVIEEGANYDARHDDPVVSNLQGAETAHAPDAIGFGKCCCVEDCLQILARGSRAATGAEIEAGPFDARYVRIFQTASRTRHVHIGGMCRSGKRDRTYGTQNNMAKQYILPHR